MSFLMPVAFDILLGVYTCSDNSNEQIDSTFIINNQITTNIIEETFIKSRLYIVVNKKLNIYI